MANWPVLEMFRCSMPNSAKTPKCKTFSIKNTRWWFFVLNCVINDFVLVCVFVCASSQRPSKFTERSRPGVQMICSSFSAGERSSLWFFYVCFQSTDRETEQDAHSD